MTNSNNCVLILLVMIGLISCGPTEVTSERIYIPEGYMGTVCVAYNEVESEDDKKGFREVIINENGVCYVNGKCKDGVVFNKSHKFFYINKAGEVVSAIPDLPRVSWGSNDSLYFNKYCNGPIVSARSYRFEFASNEKIIQLKPEGFNVRCVHCFGVIFFECN